MRLSSASSFCRGKFSYRVPPCAKYRGCVKEWGLTDFRRTIKLCFSTSHAFSKMVFIMCEDFSLTVIWLCFPYLFRELDLSSSNMGQGIISRENVFLQHFNLNVSSGSISRSSGMEMESRLVFVIYSNLEKPPKYHDFFSLMQPLPNLKSIDLSYSTKLKEIMLLISRHCHLQAA